MPQPHDDGSHSSTATPLPPARGPGRGAGGPPRVVGTGPDPLAGRTLGRCRLIERVGMGRTALVYKAHYAALDDVVAVKILRDEAAALPELVEKFHSEARVLARIDNENVLKIYDVGTQDDLHYMVVELLEGEEVLDLIQREERIEVTDALRIIRQAANGLAAAHAQGLIHRDVKPQNLFLLEDGTVKVMDFGLAARLEDGSSRVGTPHYMAPEVCETGQAELASDIYGLGVTLYHLLVGQPPYAGKDVKQILQAHIQGEPLRPERHVPGLPREVADLLRLLTKRDALLRPTAAQAIEALDRIGGRALQQKDTLKHSRRRRVSRARMAVARRARGQRQVPAIALVLGLVGAVGLAFLLLGGDEPPKGPGPAPAGTPPSEAVATGADTPVNVPVAVESRPSAEEEAARAEAQRKLAEEAEGREALERARRYARETWTTDEHTDAVVEKYRYVATRYKDTEAGKEARDLVRRIRAREVHPHPERAYAAEETVAEVRARWEAALPRIREHVARHDYLGARDLVPAAVADASGQLTLELTFWREHLDRLQRFKHELGRAVVRLDEAERTLTTPDGPGVVQGMDPLNVTLKVGTRVVRLGWDAFPARALARLAQRALAEGGAETKLLRMAFAFAHRLENEFWEADLDLGASADRAPQAAAQRAYTDRWEAK